MKYLVLLLYLSLCAFAGIILPAPAHAAEADAYWNCATTGGVQQWCADSATYPMPMTPQAATFGGATYTHIAAGQATTVVKASAGTLYAIVLNSKATASNVTTVYDNASGSGTVIGIPDTVNANAGTTFAFGPAGVAFANGLTIITTTANGGDMTVIWK